MLDSCPDIVIFTKLEEQGVKLADLCEEIPVVLFKEVDLVVFGVQHGAIALLVNDHSFLVLSAIMDAAFPLPPTSKE